MYRVRDTFTLKKIVFFSPQAARDESPDATQLPNRRGVVHHSARADPDPPMTANPDSDAADKPVDPLPVNYDARTAHKQCPSIARVHNQGDCDASWAVATADALTDRLCIHSKGARRNDTISAQDLIGCCAQCADNGCEGGGGDPELALDYWMNVGLVSGDGRYGSRSGCRPYLYAPDRERLARPECRQRCRRGFAATFAADRRFGRDARRVPQDEKSIRKEIFTNGPVVASFLTNDALDCYRSGVYTGRMATAAGQASGRHAVRLIGWGVEAGRPYWLAVNSWGKRWGEKGLVKLGRGQNEAGIEGRVLAGFPEL